MPSVPENTKRATAMAGSRPHEKAAKAKAKAKGKSQSIGKSKSKAKSTTKAAAETEATTVPWAETKTTAMKTLLLLRHAKSGWDDPDLADHDRPLDWRGERAALVIGRYIEQEHLLPELVLCSTARRAMETHWLAKSQWKNTPPTEFDRGLYLTGAPALIQRLIQVDDRFKRVLIIGHNPDLHDLVLQFAHRGDPALLAEAKAKFPTAAFAILKLPIDRWADLPGASATLFGYVTPKTLV